MINQVATFLNTASKGILGTQLVAGQNSTWVTYGNELVSSQTNKDSFFKTLFNLIGESKELTKLYTKRFPTVYKNAIDYGTIMQTIDTDMVDLVPSDVVDVVDGKEYPYVVHKTTVRQKLFDNQVAYQLVYTMPSNKMIRLNFRDETAAAAFLNSIVTAMANVITVAQQGLVQACVGNRIAHAIKFKESETNTLTAQNLLAMYNEKTNAGYTFANCLEKEDFLSFVAETFNKDRERLGWISSRYNEEGLDKHTADPRMILHADVESALRFKLRSNTFNEFLVRIDGSYESVPYWQQSGLTYNFDDTSSVDYTIKYEDEEVNVKQKGILGIMFDEYALGCTLFYDEIRSAYNAQTDTTTYYRDIVEQYYNNLGENFVVYYIAEE